MKKMEITTNTKISTPVKSSSDVNILSSPITTVCSRLPGPVLEDHLESLERNMTQLFNILTTTVNNNKEASWLHAELFFVLVSMFFPGHHMVSAWKAHGVHI